MPDTNNTDVTKGELYYIPAGILGIKTVSAHQYFKIQIHKTIDEQRVLILVKHFKTKECNKVTLILDIKVIKEKALPLTL